jgi:hypothetical protein
VVQFTVADNSGSTVAKFDAPVGPDGLAVGSVTGLAPGTYTLQASVGGTAFLATCAGPGLTLTAPTASANANCQAAVPLVYVVKDDCDPNPTVTQTPTPGTLVGLGTTPITVTVVDAQGKNATQTTSFTVTDATPPTLTLTTPASAVADANCSAAVPRVAFTVMDDCDPNPSVFQSPAAGTKVGLGPTTITVTATDASGNATEQTTSFTVVDTTPPVVTLNGSSTMTVECHSGFTDPGAKASDSCAATLTVQTKGAVDPNTPGTYILTYTATDPSGNIGSATRMVTVVDTTPPVVTLNGSSTVTALLNSTWVDPGWTATDNCGTPTVVVSPSLNTSVPGQQILSYTATDASGNKATVHRTVYVQYAVPGTSCMVNGTLAPGHMILQPINPDGSSVFKQGSTVPVKFRVFDANCHSIGTSGLVTSFVLYQTTQGTVSSVNEVVDSDTPDTGFHWDPVQQQWIFNISTKLLKANQAYFYRITLDDTTTIQFSFGLR